MNVNGKPYRTIWLDPANPSVVRIIDQRRLPHRFVIEELRSVADVATAIRDMHVRGAGLIGAAAGYGMYLATLEGATQPDFEKFVSFAASDLLNARPTAVNLSWAVNRQLDAIQNANTIDQKVEIARHTATAIADEDADSCRRIGMLGLELIRVLSEKKEGDIVNILTHCNAGWLAFVDHGSALSPVYTAFDQGIDVHVWVDETRPRNQGARLTAWELSQHGVPHTVITDNAGGHLMHQGMVDLVLVGSDRTTYTGDVANKIGTYLKALAAKDNDIPFYVALPSSTIDWDTSDGVTGIPIEQRGEEEVKYIGGLFEGKDIQVLLTPESSPAANYAFDVTPARLVTGLITERGICGASETGILALFPERKKAEWTKGI